MEIKKQNLPVPRNLIPKRVNGIRNFVAEWSRDMVQDYNDPLSSNIIMHKPGRHEYLSIEIEDNDGKLHTLEFVKIVATGEVFLKDESHSN